MAAHHQLAFPVTGSPAAARQARHRVVSTVRGWDIQLGEAELDGIELVAGELIANAVQHGAPGPISVDVRQDGRALVVAVHDTSSTLPQPGQAGADAESGRGLHLVSVLADRHGADRTATGKRCWAAFVLPLSSNPEESPVSRTEEATAHTTDSPLPPRVIDRFAGPWEFLSNYSAATVRLDGLAYPTVEHAYQAAKTLDPAIRERIAREPDPDEAKRLGRRHADREDWEEAKVAVMRSLVGQKFQEPALRERLLATGTAELVEGNDWGDEFWGVCAGHGQNTMGLILMAVREQARRDQSPSPADQHTPTTDIAGSVGCAAQARIPTAHGVFTAWGYRNVLQGGEHLALTLGGIRGADRVLVRVHSECLTGEALGSLRCDCGPQLDAALAAVAAEGAGVVLYLRGHEGRGIGLLAKLRAYALQDAGFDTVDANASMGLPADARDYRVAAQMLADLGVRSVRLLSNNPDKAEALTALGVDVAERVPLLVEANVHSLEYLRTKRDRMGHDLPGLPELMDASDVEHAS
ncbi:GTP cyclohydrolase II [Streptomyces sp. NPDC059851]|uniref:GTP cyclohydrolase II n=1 Tax=Streptomyces sp. NPDC059851 TaxID=3346971 RepID=UPI0036648FA8